MKVFLSHAHSDDALARKVSAALTRAGLQVWDPAVELLPGDNWYAQTSEALKGSDAMVVLLTPNWLTAGSVHGELQSVLSFAFSEERYKHRVIPVIVGEGVLESDDLPWIVKHLQTIRLQANGDDEEGIARIAGALKAAG